MTQPDPSPLPHPTDALVGQTLAVCALRAQIRHLTAFDMVGNPYVPTLLLLGETGTGKGLAAQLVHDSGSRAQGPFVVVNCAAIPETLLEAEMFGFEAGAFTDARRAKPRLFAAASGGTLFLDEIEALPLALQPKLLTGSRSPRVLAKEPPQPLCSGTVLLGPYRERTSGTIEVAYNFGISGV